VAYHFRDTKDVKPSRGEVFQIMHHLFMAEPKRHITPLNFENFKITGNYCPYFAFSFLAPDT